jgi:hypothetical protein
MDHYARWGNARLTCRHFDISAQTFYRWKRRFDPYDLTSLEDQSRRPEHVRKPQTPEAVVDQILVLRQRYPRWGKDKLVDGVQIRLQSDDIRYQFSARDALSRGDCSRGYRRASSSTAVSFLEYMERKFPFPIRAIQIDGGSEFKQHFEEACRARTIRLFVVLPRSPKLQGYVERSNRTHREEFYEVEDIEIRLEDHNRQLEIWDKTYNFIRPHQSLDYLTPNEYYQRWLKEHKPKVSLM